MRNTFTERKKLCRLLDGQKETKNDLAHFYIQRSGSTNYNKSIGNSPKASTYQTFTKISFLCKNISVQGKKWNLRFWSLGWRLEVTTFDNRVLKIWPNLEPNIDDKALEARNNFSTFDSKFEYIWLVLLSKIEMKVGFEFDCPTSAIISSNRKLGQTGNQHATWLPQILKWLFGSFSPYNSLKRRWFSMLGVWYDTTSLLFHSWNS